MEKMFAWRPGQAVGKGHLPSAGAPMIIAAGRGSFPALYWVPMTMAASHELNIAIGTVASLSASRPRL